MSLSQTQLKEIKSQYNKAILEINEIKNDLDIVSSNNENLIQPDKLKSLQDKFNKLNLENDKNISLIKILNKKIDDLKSNIQSIDVNSNDLSNNPDCWKSAKGSCMEEKRINSGNIRSGNIGGTGN